MRESPCSEIDFDQMTMTKMTTFNSSFTMLSLISFVGRQYE